MKIKITRINFFRGFMTYVQKYIIGMGLENINLVYLQDIKTKKTPLNFEKKLKC